MDFGAGLLGGFLSSMPLGPINLIVIDLVAQRRIEKLVWFLLGAILADALVAAASLFGLIYVDLSPRVALALGALCAAILLAYAVASWQSSQGAAQPTPRAPIAIAGLGFSLCLFNPLFPLFWVSFVASYEELFASSRVFPPAFLSGLVIGDALWFLLIGSLAGWLLRERGDRFLMQLRKGTSLGILGCGLYLVVEVLKRAL